MVDSDHTHRAARASGGFPLTSLALLVTTVAVIFTCTNPAGWHEWFDWLTEAGTSRLRDVFGSAGLFGGIVGITHLIMHGFGWRKLFLAMAGGWLAAWFCLMIIFAPAPLWRSLMAMAVFLASVVFLRIGAE